jgi:hypothetical protein
MPDQLFTYYIFKNPYDNIYKQWELGDSGYLARDRTWVIGKGGTKREGHPLSVGGDCVGRRGSVVTGWGRVGGRGKEGGEGGEEGAKRVVGRENNVL